MSSNMSDSVRGGWVTMFVAGDMWYLSMAVATFVLCCMHVLMWVRMRRRSWQQQLRRRPPGPAMGLPLLGHMHLLGPFPYKSLHKLSQRYGPIMYLHMGSSPTVVISSPSLAKQFVHDLDEAFAFRPATESGQHMFYDHTNVGLMQFDDPHWKEVRKLFARELLSPSALLTSKQLRNEEVRLRLQAVRRNADNGECVEVRSLAIGWILDLMTRLLFKRRVGEPATDARAPNLSEFPDALKEMADLFSQPLLGDAVPCLRWLDPQGLRSKMKMLATRMDALLQGLLDDALQQQHAVTDQVAASCCNVVSALLNHFGVGSTGDRASDDNISFQCRPVKGIILDMLIASTDTTSTTVEWAMLELLRESSKSKMARLKEELRGLVQLPANDQQVMVDETQANSLPYLQAVVKETLRLHPPAPLLFPHLAREPTEICGYSLPSNTKLFFNVWAMGRDESLWEAAHEFRPERFLAAEPTSSDVDVQQQQQQPPLAGLLGGQNQSMIMAFGRGRRACPGQNLGMTMVSLLLANLVHHFDWQPVLTPSPKLKDEEASGRLLGRLEHPFVAKPSIPS